MTAYRFAFMLVPLLFLISGCIHAVDKQTTPQNEAYGLELNSEPQDSPADPFNETLEQQEESSSIPTTAEPAILPDSDTAQVTYTSVSFKDNWGVYRDGEPTYTLDDPVPEEELDKNMALLDTGNFSDTRVLKPGSGHFIEKNIQPQKSVQTILDEALGFCQAAQEFWQKGELENALESLDQAYSLILDIEVQNKPDLRQQKEDIRFLISKRILEIYASRNIVVTGNYNAIPLDMNRHVQAEIRLFTTGAEKKFFRQSLVRSGRYHPYIVSKLKEAGLPEELSWVPLIESGFKVKALSKARALGLWQFIPSTGYKFGLKRDQYIDERIDPIKSTDAAIAYLKELHRIFGDWTTVLAAYNCGEGRVLRVIRSQNINYLDNFWDLYERLPRETARYVPRFLATLHIMKDPGKYGLDSAVPDPPFNFETVEVSRQVQVTDIAHKIGVTGKEIKALNPELRYNILPPDVYLLKVPPGTSELLLSTIDDIPISSPPRPAYVYHRVRSGETLSGIATRYRTSVRRIMRANNMRSSHYIVAGKKLKIPQKGTVITRTTKPVKMESGKPVMHVVKRGDSLWIIAKRYGTTTQKIQKINNMNTTKLYAGQRLKIPGSPYKSSSGEVLNTYLVRRGDSPYNIARRHNMSLGHLLRLNKLTPRSKIYPGQELTVK